MGMPDRNPLKIMKCINKFVSLYIYIYIHVENAGYYIHMITCILQSVQIVSWSYIQLLITLRLSTQLNGRLAKLPIISINRDKIGPIEIIFLFC